MCYCGNVCNRRWLHTAVWGCRNYASMADVIVRKFIIMLGRNELLVRPSRVLHFVAALLFNIFTLVCSASSSVSLSYFILDVLRCQCWGQLSVMTEWSLFFSLSGIDIILLCRSYYYNNNNMECRALVHMTLIEFHTAVFAWPCFLSDLPLVLWWLSSEGWDAVTCGWANCKNGAPTGSQGAGVKYVCHGVRYLTGLPILSGGESHGMLC